MPGRRTAPYFDLGSAVLAAVTVVASAVAVLSSVGFADGSDVAPAAAVAEVSSTREEPAGSFWLETSSIRVEASSQPEVASVAEPIEEAEPAEPADAAVEPEPVVSPTVDEAEVNPPVAPISPEEEAPPSPAGPVERWATEGFVLVREGQDLDDDSLASIDQALAALPARIRATVAGGDLGPVYILVNTEGRTLSGGRPYGRAANFFYTNEARNELVLYPNQSAQTVLHELGHAFNLREVAAGRYAFVLLEPEMQSFMAATGWQVEATPEEIAAARDHTEVPMSYIGPSIWPRLSHDDPLEDFANSFALYFLAPEELRDLSAVRFDWFEANVGR